MNTDAPAFAIGCLVGYALLRLVGKCQYTLGYVRGVNDVTEMLCKPSRPLGEKCDQPNDPKSNGNPRSH